MSILNILIGAVVALGGIASYFFVKARSAKSLLDNFDIKTQVQNEQGDIVKNDALIAAEQQKQQQIADQANQEINKQIDLSGLADFFNNQDKK